MSLWGESHAQVLLILKVGGWLAHLQLRRIGIFPIMVVVHLSRRSIALRGVWVIINIAQMAGDLTEPADLLPSLDY